ncbi:MAG: biotin/lipoyl-containing protein, partial [Pseudomonadota bacterium]
CTDRLHPRHVEIQVFADTQGNVIHLGERDCSVQRRHQKVVEEAPCPVMTEELRARMGAAAVEAARSIEYRGAGTVEFLLDESGAFYFLEMNTRLQVEHPVTELITGLDLVAMQIQVAQGKPLNLSQDDVEFAGHAIEVRLYAEDPAQDFLPCTGIVELWQPATGDGVRIDSGIETGQAVSPFYDPMIAKVISWGETREIAQKRLVGALKESLLFGMTINKPFLIDVLEKEAFKQGQATTAFIEEEFDLAALAQDIPTLQHAAIAAALQYRSEYEAAQSNSVIVSPELRDWSSTGNMLTRYEYDTGEAVLDLTVSPQGHDSYLIAGGDKSTTVVVQSSNGAQVTVLADGRRQTVHYQAPAPGKLHLAIDGRTFTFQNRLAIAASEEEQAGGGRVVAPMHGNLLEVFVQIGEMVQKGARLAILEAMKMQHEILAEVDGEVKELGAAPGSQIAAGDLILEIEEAS